MNQARLAELCRVSVRGLQKMLVRIEKEGYVKRWQSKVQSTELWRDTALREDDTQHEQSSQGTNKVRLTHEQSSLEGTNKVPDTIVICNNNKDIGSGPAKKEEKETHDPLKSLPEYLGNSSITRLISLYSCLWFEQYGTKYKADWAIAGRHIKLLLGQHTEWQVAALMVILFSWQGANGDDEFTGKRFETAMYPISWITKNVNEFSTYITNVLGVNFEDPVALKQYVKDEVIPALKAAEKEGIIKIKR